MKKDKNIFRTLNIKSEVLKNTSILISGTALAQMIPILLQPILRRYFTPETFGAYAIYLSLLGILIVISSFKYELAIILPRKDKEAANVFFLALIINILFNLLLILVIVTLKFQILHFLNLSDEFAIYLYFVPLGTFLFNFYQSINYWLIRKKRFFAISQNKFIRRGFEGSTQVGFKLLNVTNGLIWGDLLGHLANVSSGIYQSVRKGLDISHFSLTKLRYVFLKYIEYPKFNLIPGLLSACSYMLPAIFINKFFSSEYTGYFDLSKLVLSIPLALIATSISNVLLQRVVEKFKNNQSFINELYPIMVIVLFIALCEILVILFFGENLFKLFFGELWGISGKISKILVWSYAFNFFIASFSSLFISMKKIKILSVWQLVYFTAILSLILFKNSSFTDFLNFFVLIEIICYMIITFLMVIIVLKYELKIKEN
ncbi:MAG: oligosaccharide flippase family protein [Bacteroidales bacterium]|nr:oligosaccharide flippase family protein [Bacteroidales bacterium]